jgi:hypothetical protein
LYKATGDVPAILFYGGHASVVAPLKCAVSESRALVQIRPHFFSNADHQFQLPALVIDANRISLFHRGETALRAESQLFDRLKLRCLLDPPQHIVCDLHLWYFGADQAQNDTSRQRNIRQVRTVA